MAITSAQRQLLEAVTGLRDRVAATRLPLDVAGAEQARMTREEIARQIDDYILPRLRRLDAPLLAVVGGSTGAGKSTLLNSLVGKQISAPGVLRPTTRSPVLACNPADKRWFADQRILPSMARSSGAAGDEGTLHLVPDQALPSGLALLDAPDIDSVVRDNRRLAAQLLAAADLWLFVTTAARYADAVPWDLLLLARERSTALAVVLDRVPQGAEDEVAHHFASMLSEHGLGGAPLFVVPEAELTAGLLPERVIAPIRGWLTGLTADAEARNAVVRRTLEGALDSLRIRLRSLVGAAEAQVRARERLERAVVAAYAVAAHAVEEGITDGSLLRGEVLARWQEFVGTGEILRSLEAQIGRIRDRITAAVTGKPQPGTELRQALESSVESLVITAADRAAERVSEAWRAEPAGSALLAAAETRGDDLTRVSAELPDDTAKVVREWQGYVLDLVRSQGADKRATARFLSYGVNGSGLLVMLVVFAHTGGLTGAEVGVAGGTSLLSQKILEAVFGDQAVRRLASDARTDLSRRVDELLSGEQVRFTDMLRAEDVAPDDAADLKDVLVTLDEARKAADQRMPKGNGLAEKAASDTAARSTATPSPQAPKKAAPSTEAPRKAAPSPEAPRKAAPSPEAPTKAAPTKAAPKKTDKATGKADKPGRKSKEQQDEVSE